MSLIPVACHKCGAPLEVPDEARFVTCRHCGIQLEVKHNETAAWTEQIEDIKEQTEELVEQVAQIQYQNALDTIKRDWQSFKHKNPPVTKAEMAGGLIGTCCTIFLGIQLTSVPLLVLAVGGGVFIIFMSRFRNNRYKEAESKYHDRKASLDINDFHKQALSQTSANQGSDHFDS